MLVGRRREMGLDTSYTTAGWTCSVCGMFVGHSDYHLCGGTPNYETPDWTCGACGCVVKHGLAHHCSGAQPVTLDPLVLNRDAEIIDLLQGILGILELFAEDKGFIRLD